MPKFTPKPHIRTGTAPTSPLFCSGSSLWKRELKSVSPNVADGYLGRSEAASLCGRCLPAYNARKRAAELKSAKAGNVKAKDPKTATPKRAAKQAAAKVKIAKRTAKKAAKREEVLSD